MNAAGCLLCLICGQKLRPITFGDLSEEFCRLPRHDEMSDAFVASRGRYGRTQFKEDFDAPDWAYDFLRCLTGYAGGDAPDYEGVDSRIRFPF